MTQGFGLKHTYRIICWDRHTRKPRWTEIRHNLVTTLGLNDILDQYFAGSAYTAGWFVGFVDNIAFTTFSAADTAAKITLTANPPTTNGWQEFNKYGGSRPALVFGAASGGAKSNSGSPASITCNASGEIKGIFLASSTTIGGTSGILHSEVAFSAARSVINLDPITVIVTLTIVGN